MESTGKYWIPVYNILENTCTIVLVHPKYVKAIRGKKTDKKDAKWITDIFKHDLVSGSFIPPADIRQLRDLMRYYGKLTNFTTGEKNRVQNCLTVSNIKLEDRVTHGGHSVLRWMMDNIYIRTDPASNIKPDKEKPTEKIDGAVATVMALDKAIHCGNDTSTSVYDDRGILFI